MPWTAKTRAAAKDLWATPAIAGEIAKACGVSRGAVIGMARRAGWGPKPFGAPGDKLPRRRRPRQAAAPAVKAAPQAIAPIKAPAKVDPLAIVAPPIKVPRHTEPVPLVDIGAGECRFLIGDGVPWLMCGAPQEPGASYCAAHCRVCFNGAWGQ